MTQLEMIVELVTCMEQAIRSGDWKVDGACDPDHLLEEASEMLTDAGYRRDGITGQEWILDRY